MLAQTASILFHVLVLSTLRQAGAQQRYIRNCTTVSCLRSHNFLSPRFLQSSSANISVVEYEALRDLYDSTNGLSWTWESTGGKQWNFTVYEDPCQKLWQGVDCERFNANSTFHVVKLLLPEHNLVGSLPDSMGNFPKLLNLVLKNNSLVGSVPGALGNLLTLQMLNLNNNKLDHSLPSALGNLTQLQVFDFWANELTGTIPSYLHKFHLLEYLDISVNHLHGSIPASLGDLIRLQHIYFDHNSLDGTLPASLGKLHHVRDFYVDVNRLQGTIPREFSGMKSLAYLFLYQNRFEGNLDHVFNATTQVNLTMVRISKNKFTGALPDQLFLLPKLTVIDAVTNCLKNKPLSDKICNATNLQTIALDGMHTGCQKKIRKSTYRLTPSVRGTLPSCIFELPSLISLHLSSNGIKGTLPESAQFGSAFNDLQLSHNFFEGSIPAVFQSHPWSNLDLSFNKLSGVLSSNFSVIASSASLSLRDNRLSGPLPNTIIHAVPRISVLEGNWFECRQDERDLPAQDNFVEQFQCGSNSFNLAYYVWLGLFCVLVCGAMLYFAYRKQTVIDFSSTFGRMMHNARRAVHVLNLKLNVEEFEFDLGRAATVEREVEVDPKHAEDPKFLKYHLRNYHKICCICQLILRGCVAMTAYIIAILMPLYGILSIFYSTLTYQYAYQLSLAFASGIEPLVLCMIFLMTGLAFLFHWFWVFYKEFVGTFERFETEIHYDVRKDRANATESTESSKSRAVVYLGRSKGVMYVCLILINMFVVVGANVLFVFMVLYGNQMSLSLAPWTLAVFKFAWGWVCARVTYLLARQLDKHHEDLKKGLFSTLCVITLFNNIVVPCLVVMAISTQCFYNTVEPGEEVEVSYTFQECADYDQVGCITQETTADNSYLPPFVYSYQCADTILTYYAPSFVYTSIIQGIWFPLVRWTVARILKTFSPHTLGYKLLLSITPLILKPVPATSEAPPAEVGPFFDSRAFVATLLNYLAVILTFGVVFPPLAFCMTMTIISTVFFTRHEIKRFLKNAALKGSFLYINRIDQECVGIGTSVLLQRAVTLLITLSCWFYSLFLFDILGDRQQLKGAYWVLVVMIFLPAFLFASYEVYILAKWLLRVYNKSTSADNILHLEEETTSPLPRAQRPLSMQVEMMPRQDSANSLAKV